MRTTFESMGTVVSLEAPAVGHPLVRRVFETAEARFSLFRPDSELSRVAAGELPLTRASAELLDTYARAVLWRERTDGAFTPNRPDGVIDLNGIVKAEAVEAAGAALTAAGCHHWSINAGGDILVADAGHDGAPHLIALADPADASATLCAITLAGPRRAVATSGSAQRGDHIWRGGSRTPAAFVQVSVVADDIVTADVLATAIVASGRDTLDAVCDRWDVDVFTVDRDGAMLATPGLRAALAA